MKQVVEGTIFIVPNASEQLDSFCEPEWEMEKLRRLLGLRVNYEEKMIQVWAYGENCDNWMDQYGGFQQELGIEWWGKLNTQRTRDQRLKGYFPRYLPASVLERKSEGSVIEFNSPEYKVTIRLTCKQDGSRYERFGKFEEVYQQVM